MKARSTASISRDRSTLPLLSWRLPEPVLPADPMLTAPILPMLARLSLPNMMAMLAMALVTIAETAYVGILGTPPLAGLALVFPLVMLQRCCQAAAWAAVFRPLLVARLAPATNSGRPLLVDAGEGQTAPGLAEHIQLVAEH